MRYIQVSGTGRFRCVYLQIDYDGLLSAAHDDALAHFVLKRVDLLMRYKCRDINEIAWSRLIAELKAIAPAHPSAPLNDIKNRLQCTVVMGPGLGVGLHCDCTRPKLAGSCPSVCNRCGPRHARSLRRIRVHLACPNDFDAVIFPIHAPDYVNIPARVRRLREGTLPDPMFGDRPRRAFYGS